MAYNPTVWQTGDIVTAEKLNNIERGIEDASAISLKVNITTEDRVSWFSDVTYNQVVTALNAGRRVFAIVMDMEVPDEGGHSYTVLEVSSYGHDENWQTHEMLGPYYVMFGVFTSSVDLYADSADAILKKEIV